jgi:predicted transcriptional regulator
MDIIYQMGKANAAEVTERLPGSPRNATVRKLLSILEDKRFIDHERIDNKFIYSPTISAEKARNSAMDHLLDTFFEGNAGNAVITLMKRHGTDLSEEERHKIQQMISESRMEGR